MQEFAAALVLGTDNQTSMIIDAQGRVAIGGAAGVGTRFTVIADDAADIAAGGFFQTTGSGRALWCRTSGAGEAGFFHSVGVAPAGVFDSDTDSPAVQAFGNSEALETADIVTVGDSFTEGSHVSDAEAWPVRLGRAGRRAARTVFDPGVLPSEVLMNRRRTVVTLLLVIAALTPIRLLAHGGHGKGEIAPYDLDTPRKVSPETAAHIGLQTAEVDFGTVEEILRLIGVVRAIPDRVRAVASRIDGTALRVAVQVGDTVRAGDVLVEIESPALARDVYELRALDTKYLELQGQVARARSRIAELQVQAREAEPPRHRARPGLRGLSGWDPVSDRAGRRLHGIPGRPLPPISTATARSVSATSWSCWATGAERAPRRCRVGRRPRRHHRHPDVRAAPPLASAYPCPRHCVNANRIGLTPLRFRAIRWWGGWVGMPSAAGS